MAYPADFRLAAITKNKVNPAYAGARLGVDRVAAAWGAAVEHYVPESPDDVEEQYRLVEQAIDERPDALLVVPAHTRALNPVFQEAAAAGIPLFCFASRPEEQDCVTFVGADDYRCAFEVAYALFTHSEGRGKFVVLEGHPNSPTAAPRSEGFRAAAAEFPSVEIVEAVRGDFLFEPAHRQMGELLKRHRHIDGVVAANDLMALGAIESMRAADRRALVVGINASPDGIAAIRAGTMYATVAFDAMKMGCIVTEAAIRHLLGEGVPDVVLLPAETVRADNCAAWDTTYSERPLPNWREVVPTEHTMPASE